MKVRRIKDLAELRKLCSKSEKDFALMLKPAGLYSRKGIRYEQKTKMWEITHYIDDTYEQVSDKEISNSRIGLALAKGALCLMP